MRKVPVVSKELQTKLQAKVTESQAPKTNVHA